MSDSSNILVVDDDRGIRDLISQFLKQHGYRVTTARDGREMSEILSTGRIDMVILDVMLPGRSGLELCRELRMKSHLPILMLTAMGDETDRVVGLEMGADDYLPKPFSSRELLARIRAILRRVNNPAASPGLNHATTAVFADWRLDLARRRLQAPDGVMVVLTSGEYSLLIAFLEHPQRVLTRDQLLDFARGREAMSIDRSIDVQVSRLRRKIESDPGAPEIIVTVRGDGYMLATQVQIE